MKYSCLGNFNSKGWFGSSIRLDEHTIVAIEGRGNDIGLFVFVDEPVNVEFMRSTIDPSILLEDLPE